MAKNRLLKNINLGAHFLFLLILCSIKIERLLFLKFLKNLAFFDSYFWPFNKSEEKIKVIFVISAIKASIWNVFIKFRWHDEKITKVWNSIFNEFMNILAATPVNIVISRQSLKWNWIFTWTKFIQNLSNIRAGIAIFSAIEKEDCWLTSKQCI